MRQRCITHGIRIGALALLALLLCAPVLRADEKAEAESDAKEQLAFEREQLVYRARESVDPTRPEVGGLDELKELVEQKREDLQALDPGKLSRIDWLLGKGENKGLIREGAELYRWIAGLGGEGKEPVLFLQDPESEERDEYPAREGPEREVRDATWPVVVDKKEDGAFKGTSYTWLAQLPEQWQSIALTNKGELGLEVNTPLVDAWMKQVGPRVKAIEAEKTSSIVATEGTVAQKANRVKTLRDGLADVNKRRARLATSLDALVIEERRLQDNAGRLGFEVDKAKREAGDKPSEETAKALLRLQLQEAVAEQELRLLYITVRRADLRIELYDRLIRQAKTVSDAAESTLRHFAGRLDAVRRSRQIDQLDSESRKLERLHVEAHGNAEKPPEGQADLWKAYDEALEALLVLNEVASDAVRKRRAMEAKTNAEIGSAPEKAEAGDAGTTAEGATAESATASAEGASPETPAAEKTSAAKREPAKRDLLARFRDPRPAKLDADYCEDAAALLNDPAWDRELVALHHGVVRDRVRDLEAALRIAGEARALRGRFETARAQAETALAETDKLRGQSKYPWRWTRRLLWHRERNFDASVSAFNETLEGVEEKAREVEQDLQFLRTYRRKLLDLGPRSFGIRVSRDLDAGELTAAGKDAIGGLAAAGRWVTFQGDDHLGTFVARHWLMLLACLGVLLATFFGVKFGRRAVDRILRAMASRVPVLRAQPVTVRAENAEAERSKAVLKAAAKRAEEAALREVSKEEAGKAQKMGEGGYGQ